MSGRGSARGGAGAVWTTGRASSAGGVVLALAMAWMLLAVGPPPGSAFGVVLPVVFGLVIALDVVALVHPAATRIDDDAVCVRGRYTRWRRVQRSAVSCVEVSTGRWASALVLVDGRKLVLPGLPVDAARALATAGPAAARQLAGAR